MAKVQTKSERITPLGGIFQVRELFSRFVGPVIDKVRGLRCTSFCYQYGEIAGSLASVYFCGGDCVVRVSQLSGIGPDEPIGIPSDRPARWISVARAMAIQENGTAQIDDFAMLKGFDLARQDAQ